MFIAGGPYGFEEAPVPPLDHSGGRTASLAPYRPGGDVRHVEPSGAAGTRSRHSARSWFPWSTCLASCSMPLAGPPPWRRARARGLRIVGYAEAHDLLAAARAVHGPQLLRGGNLRTCPAHAGLFRQTAADAARRPAAGTAVGLLAAGAWLSALPLSLALALAAGRALLPLGGGAARALPAAAGAAPDAAARPGARATRTFPSIRCWCRCSGKRPCCSS